MRGHERCAACVALPGAQERAGNGARPRLAVFRSNRYIYAQLIDDDAGRTVAAASSRELRSPRRPCPSRPRRGWQARGSSRQGCRCGVVVFDRGGFAYHGRVKALAEAARESGLKF